MDDSTLEQAIASAYWSASLPFRVGKTLEQTEATWVYQTGVRHALADLCRAIREPKPPAMLPSSDVARKICENIIARSDADRSAPAGHLSVVPEDVPARMLSALIGIRDHARLAIEDIDADVSADGEHPAYARDRAKWQAVLNAIEAAEQMKV